MNRFFGKNLIAAPDTLVTDEHASWPGDETLDLAVVLPTK